MNLKMSLLESVHRNEELSEILMHKEQQLEQQDKTSRAQARVIKVTSWISICQDCSELIGGYLSWVYFSNILSDAGSRRTY